jgi:hypothetical protein
MDSRRRLAARRSRAASLAFAWRCPRDPTMRRDACRATRRRCCLVAAHGAGWATRSMVSSAWAMTAHSLPMPRSIPQRPFGSRGVRGTWTTIVVTETNSRPPCSLRVIDSTRARPLATTRSRRRVFSLHRSRPMTGRVRWRRSGSRRIVPVWNRTRPRSRWRPLNRGNPILTPARRPCLDVDQACRAATRSAIPEPSASLEQSRHQGATSALAWFQALRSVGSVQARAGTEGSASRASRLAFTWARAQL